MNHAGVTPLSLCFATIKCAYTLSAWISYVQRNKKPVADAIRGVKRNLTCISDFNPPFLPAGIYIRSLRKVSRHTSLLLWL